jgi:hypothetical protein
VVGCARCGKAVDCIIQRFCALNVLPRPLALGMTAFNVLAIGALKSGNDHTGLHVVRGCTATFGIALGSALTGTSSIGTPQWGTNARPVSCATLYTGPDCLGQTVSFGLRLG